MSFDRTPQRSLALNAAIYGNIVSKTGFPLTYISSKICSLSLGPDTR